MSTETEAVIILSLLKNLVWGVPTVTLLTAIGIYFTVKCRFYTPRAIKNTAKATLGSLRAGGEGITPFRAVATALGGTVGVGSIVGVGYGIAVGGAGSIFWLWVCSFFGMGLKYAEVKIALTDRTESKNGKVGGAHVRLSSLGYKRLSLLFCLLCLLASFGTGNLTQSGAISGFFSSAGLSPTASVLCCTATVALAVFGGRERIARVNAFIVPTASVVYILSCAALLWLFREGIGDAFSLIFREAFGFSAVSGGFSAATLSHVIREGFVRGVFSGEAGMGSSPLAHSTADFGSPENQAKWGIFEIFFDSFVVSTLSAVCLLSGGFTSPVLMFKTVFGRTGELFFGLLLAVFAFASVISWCYYAECCNDFLFKSRPGAILAYRVLFTLAVPLGVSLSGATVWEISDILNAFMMLPNLFLLFIRRNEIERI